MTRLVAKKAERKTPVQDVLYNQFKQVTLNTPLSKVSRILERDHFALVVHNQRLCNFSTFLIINNYSTNIYFLLFFSLHLYILAQCLEGDCNYNLYFFMTSSTKSKDT